MALNARIGLRQQQRLALTPQIRQSLALLRLPTLSLADTVAREAAENPFLIVDPTAGGRSAYDYALATAAAPRSLADSLGHQIAMQKLDPVTEAAALYLIGELREDGYLDEPLDEIAERTGLPEEVLQDGLAALHRCEPSGIGARTLAECVELQLFDAGIDRALARAAAARLDDFAQERWDRLGRDLAVDRARLEQIAALMRGLSSAPVAADADWVSVTVPELVIERDPNGRIGVSLLPQAVPGVAVMEVERATLGTAGLRDMFERAGRFAAGLSARAETLLRIGNYIASVQSAFFLGDHATIAPVTRAEAAAALAMHPSTLGRALSGKAMLADNRLYPLSLFFARALPGADRGVSPFDVQRRIRELIAAESAAAPLADEAICAQLRKEGVDIARRTVAKYRKCMRIPSSFGRRHRKPFTEHQPRGAHKAK